MYFFKNPDIIKRIYPNKVWEKKSSEKKIFLTFDDGPTEQITPWILEQLRNFDIKATFFCLGKNIEKQPDLFKQLITEGHQIGNHTFNHENGWETNNYTYYKSILQTEKFTKNLLFRPPFGGLTMHKQKALVRYGFQVIMWDVMPGDFDKKLSKEECLKAAIDHTSKGSIIVFHDNIKAEKNMKYAFPRFVEHFLELGYEFETIKTLEVNYGF